MNRSAGQASDGSRKKWATTIMGPDRPRWTKGAKAHMTTRAHRHGSYMAMTARAHMIQADQQWQPAQYATHLQGASWDEAVLATKGHGGPPDGGDVLGVHDRQDQHGPVSRIHQGGGNTWSTGTTINGPRSGARRARQQDNKSRTALQRSGRILAKRNKLRAPRQAIITSLTVEEQTTVGGEGDGGWRE